MSKKVFKRIANESREKIEREIFSIIAEKYRKELKEDNFYRYNVELQNIKFVTYMTDEEVKICIGLAIDLLEELKEINNNGLNRKKLDEEIKKIEKENGQELIKNLKMWDTCKSKNLNRLIGEIDQVRRVGGAYAMLISNPGLMSAIYAIYDRVVDCFDDEELYGASAFFLLRAIMRVRSDEVDSFENY